MIREMIPLFITFFIVINPLGIILVYLSLSQTLTGPENKRDFGLRLGFNVFL